MRVVIIGSEHGLWKTKLIGKPRPPVATLSRACVQLFVEVGRGDVKLLRVDPDDGAVSLVQFTDLEGVLAAPDYIEIELIPVFLINHSIGPGDTVDIKLPVAHGCQHGPREFGNGAEVQAVNNLCDHINESSHERDYER